MRRIAKDLVWLQSFGGVVNVHLWNGDTLLDTGAPLLTPIFLREAARGGYPAKGFKQVLLSHCHVDHSGGLLHLSHDLNVYGHGNDLDVLHGRRPAPKYHPRYGKWVEWAESLIPKAELGKGHTTVAVKPGAKAAGWIMLSTPGHTSGSVCWYQPESRTLFTGDLLINHLDFLTGPARLFSEDYSAAMKSIQTLRELDIETILFGHGPPIINNAEKRLRNLAAKLPKE